MWQVAKLARHQIPTHPEVGAVAERGAVDEHGRGHDRAGRLGDGDGRAAAVGPAAAARGRRAPGLDQAAAEGQVLQWLMDQAAGGKGAGQSGSTSEGRPAMPLPPSVIGRAD